MCKNVVHFTHYSSFFCSCSLMHIHMHAHACIRTLLCLVHFPLAPLKITPTSLCFFDVFTKTNNKKLSSDTTIPSMYGFLCFFSSRSTVFFGCMYKNYEKNSINNNKNTHTQKKKQYSKTFYAWLFFSFSSRAVEPT